MAVATATRSKATKVKTTRKTKKNGTLKEAGLDLGRFNIIAPVWIDFFVWVQGRNILVPRAMDEKVSDQMARQQAGKPTKSKKETTRDFIDEAYSGLYRFEKVITDSDTGEEVTMGAPCQGTVYGIQAVAMKKAIVRPFKTIDGKSMQDANGQFHIDGAAKDWRGRDDLIPIIANPVKQLSYTELEVANVMDMTQKEMKVAMHEAHKYGANMRDDIVRVSSGASMPRYRMEFQDWKIPFNVRFNKDWVSHDILIGAIDRAGMEVGLCENRPEKSGDNWGTFQVATN